MPFMPVKFDLRKRVKLAQGLWILYWLSVLAGALLLGLGVFFKVELRKRSELMERRESHLLPNLLIPAGLLACALNAFGGKVCHDSLDPLKYSKWKPGLRRFLLLCCAFNALLLLLALLCFLLQFAVYLTLSRGLDDSIRFYKDTDTPGRCYMKRTLDLTQIEFRCCGNVNFRDWFEVQWISNRYLDMSDGRVKDRVLSNVEGKFLMDSVPFSCCNPGSPRPCIQHHLTNNSAHYDYDHRTEDLNIWTRGCREALFSYFSGLMSGAGALVAATVLLQCADMAGLKYLSTALETMSDPENPECESEGWLLEKSVKETLVETLGKIKTLGKSNHVQEGDQEAQA
ncbi:peripherin-2b [Hippocampus zosterae]|uniref:peripherin-2b n=1 Tax=Hippocampus zosterae TaxID=109293 RepID=UPI00223E4ADC|nr:peripherin-2b [Hippocampus zosterae]